MNFIDISPTNVTFETWCLRKLDNEYEHDYDRRASYVELLNYVIVLRLVANFDIFCVPSHGNCHISGYGFLFTHH